MDEETSNTWENIDTWQFVLPPSRPGDHQLTAIRKFLTSIAKTSIVGVLGSTPEFRDLTAEMGFETVIFEKSESTYLRMSSLRVFDSPERVIWGDWLETLGKTPKLVDVLLSDLTTGNVPFSKQSDFFTARRMALNQNGVLIDRVLNHKRPLLNYKKVLADFSSRPLNLSTANEFNCKYLFSSSLLRTRGLVDTSEFYDRALAEGRSPGISRMVALCQLVSPRDCRWWYGKSWRDWSDPFLKGYNILQTEQEPATSSYSGRAETFFLRKAPS